ncbi:hypothetical protein GCM10009799_06040 [Nocardiopsis rhodophaea]|uniref:Uncharacterized protein n=2 Tax=Nocardiopsis rhodophaea TaxID=280238 RepID=A0ABN2SBN5_9ACTN
MPIRTLALTSGDTTAEDHRLLVGSLLGGIDTTWPLDRRGGLFYSMGAASLDGEGMVATIRPFTAVVSGASSPLQGPYLVVSSEDTTVLLEDGPGTGPRADLIGVVIRDGAYDDSGTALAEVRVIDPDVDESYLPLFEVTVPQGASEGTGGIPWGSAVQDRRVYTASSGGILTLPDLAARSRLSAVQDGTLAHVVQDGDLYIRISGRWHPIAGKQAESEQLERLDNRFQQHPGEWQRVELESGVNHSGSFPVEVRRTPGGLVHMRGTFIIDEDREKLTSTSIARVPEGFEPFRLTRWVTASQQITAEDKNSTRLEVRSDGRIWVYTLYRPRWIGADNLTYWTN